MKRSNKHEKFSIVSLVNLKVRNIYSRFSFCKFSNCSKVLSTILNILIFYFYYIINYNNIILYYIIFSFKIIFTENNNYICKLLNKNI